MCSLCRLPVAKKTQFWTNFEPFRGSCTDPRLPKGPNLVCYSRPSVYACLPNFAWISLFCRPLLAKKPQFLRFFGLWHLVLLPTGNSLTKLNTGAQLQTYPYPMASKLFLYSNAFMAKSGAQDVQKRDRQKRDGQKRDGQTKKSTFLVTPAAGEIRAPPNLAW